MPKPPHALTPEQVRARLKRQGKTLSAWAREHGYPRDAVYRVMGGQYKGHFGRAHSIAVDLGLKARAAEPSTLVADGNTPPPAHSLRLRERRQVRRQHWISGTLRALCAPWRTDKTMPPQHALCPPQRPQQTAKSGALALPACTRWRSNSDGDGNTDAAVTDRSAKRASAKERESL